LMKKRQCHRQPGGWIEGSTRAGLLRPVTRLPALARSRVSGPAGRTSPAGPRGCLMSSSASVPALRHVGTRDELIRELSTAKRQGRLDAIRG
jgi:hypothetical protein